MGIPQLQKSQPQVSQLQKSQVQKSQLQKKAHDRAGELYARGELDNALAELSAAIAGGESAELWSDWGAVQAARGSAVDAERAFRRALRMDAQWRAAAENLGVLLYAQGRLGEAGVYLERALAPVRSGAGPGSDAEVLQDEALQDEALQDEVLPDEVLADGPQRAQRAILERMVRECAAFTEKIARGRAPAAATQSVTAAGTAAATATPDTAQTEATATTALPATTAQAEITKPPETTTLETTTPPVTVTQTIEAHEAQTEAQGERSGDSTSWGADPREVATVIAATEPDAAYGEWCNSVFGQRIPVPGVRIGTSWAEDSEWGLRAYNALATLECEYATELLREIAAKNIPGDVAEFGIYEGWWINYLWQATENLGLRRRVYGFDSFEGLSEPHPEHDQAFWKKGQYACGFEQVSKNVKLAERPRVKLVKGFFETSLRTAEALLPEQFCYARIDCDIYQPALQCLQYLGPRLADGAIVVFDDWPHVRGYGEQRALEEWLPSVPHLKFEFLFYGAIGHFYTRVHHRQ